MIGLQVAGANKGEEVCMGGRYRSHFKHQGRREERDYFVED
jgi:hypothetical protein